MDRLHKADIRHYRLFVRGQRITHQRGRTHGILNGVQQRQAGKDADCQLLLGMAQGLPGRNIVGERHLFRQPEVAGQAVPDLQVFIILNFVPVNGTYA